MGFPCATRHVLVDTLGLVLHVLVTAADVQDRDGGILLLFSLFGQFPFLRKLFADSASRGRCFRRHLQRHAELGDRNRQTVRSCQRLCGRTHALDLERTIGWLWPEACCFGRWSNLLWHATLPVMSGAQPYAGNHSGIGPFGVRCKKASKFCLWKRN